MSSTNVCDCTHNNNKKNQKEERIKSSLSPLNKRFWSLNIWIQYNNISNENQQQWKRKIIWASVAAVSKTHRATLALKWQWKWQQRRRRIFQWNGRKAHGGSTKLCASAAATTTTTTEIFRVCARIFRIHKHKEQKSRNDEPIGKVSRFQFTGPLLCAGCWL